MRRSHWQSKRHGDQETKTPSSITNRAMASSSQICARNEIFRAAISGDVRQLKAVALEMHRGGCGAMKTLSDLKCSQCSGSALHSAASTGRTSVCKYLIEGLKLDSNISDQHGGTPLHCAILGNHHQTAVYLINSDAVDINASTDNGDTALHFATTKGRKKLMQLLISKGVDVNAKSNFDTPLSCAANNGNQEAVMILLKNYADPNIVLHGMYSPLLYAIFAQSYECVKLLLEAGADPNGNSCAVSPLECAISSDETEILKLLLKFRANPNKTNKCGLTPLEVAAIQNKHDMATQLFRVTSPISSVLDWSLDGVLKYVHSEESVQQRKVKTKEVVTLSKAEGKVALEKEDYFNAVYWFTQALQADPWDSSVLSDRILCWTRLHEGSRALTDALVCQFLLTDWPKTFYREGVAWSLLDNFEEAVHCFLHGLAFDPEDTDLHVALQAVLEQFQ